MPELLNFLELWTYMDYKFIQHVACQTHNHGYILDLARPLPL